ncbi:MAG: hypothetical protein KAY37_03955 [Phycisphaerae bacterium]|nr:hypothetical protein [Phycisphaerae bacterium]
MSPEIENNPRDETGISPPRASVRTSWWSALVRTVLAFMFIFSTLAAGHLLMVAINAVDHAYSADVYQQAGLDARWFGDRSLTEEIEALPANASRSTVIRQPSAATDAGLDQTLRMLPISPFLLVALTVLTALGLGLLVVSRRVHNDALQSVIGVFAGLLIWTGAVEYGLMIASRSLGVAKAVKVHADQLIGVYGEYVLLKHSWGLLVVVLIYLLFLESNRCNVFLWLRRKLALMRGAVATGRVDNFAPRTAFQYIMIIWTFYVLLLWAYDPTAFGPDGVFTHIIFFCSFGTAGFLLLRLYRQKTMGPAIRYAIGVAIVGWIPIEIAAKWGLFREPWLILNPLTAVAFFGGAILGTWLIVREIKRSSNTGSATHLATA